MRDRKIVENSGVPEYATYADMPDPSNYQGLAFTQNDSSLHKSNGVEWYSWGYSALLSDRPSAASFGKGEWVVAGVTKYLCDGANWALSGREKQYLPALIDYDIGRYATGAAAPEGKLDLIDYDNCTWTITNGTGVTAAKVTTHAKENDTTFNVNLPAVAAQSCQARTSFTAKDLTAYDYIEVVLFSNEFNASYATGVTLLLYTNYSADRFTVSIGQLKPGWKICKIPKASFATAGSPLWSSIVTLRLVCDSISQNTRTLFFASFKAVKTGLNKGCISLGFDDSLLDHHLAGVLAAERGIKLTFFCMPSVIGTAGRLSFAQIYALQRMGHEVGMHGPDSGANWQEQLANTGAEEFTAKMLANREIGLAHGWDTEIASYPQGIHDTFMLDPNTATLNTALRAAGMKYIRCTENYATKSGASELAVHALYSSYYKKSTYYIAGGLNLEAGITLVHAKAHVDNAIAYGSWYNPYSHSLAATNGAAQTWAVQDYKDLLDYLVVKRNLGVLDVRPFGDVARDLEANDYISSDYES